jgi:uncharacterized membrane protein
MKQALTYTGNIFVTTVLSGPVIVFVLLALSDPLKYNDTDAMYTVVAIPAGFVLYLPSWLLLWWLTTCLGKSVSSIIMLKVYLSFVCLPLSILPFFIMNYRAIIHSNYWPSLAPWVCTYAVITMVGIWFYKLR